MRGFIRMAAAVAITLGIGGIAAADETVKVNSFPSASNLPIWIGQQQGLFHRHGVEVVLSHPQGSVDQFKGLMAGTYDVLLTALDNVAAYHDGHGAADLGGPIDLVAIMGMDNGFLTFVAAPELKQIADLKGKVMAVDALTTGFSFALLEVLHRAGIEKDAVSYVAVGSTGARFKALQDGKAQAALLTMPVDLEALDKGYNKLATVAGTLGHYQATVGAARQSWAAAHKATLVEFLRGYREAAAWLVAPEHKDRSIEILHKEMPSLDQAKLGRVYAMLADQKEGIAPDLHIDPAGAEMVLSLRARYGEPAQPAPDWRRYVDLTYLDAAK